MTRVLKRIWASINKVLTYINFFLLSIYTGSGLPASKTGKPVTIPLWANLLLLAVLVSMLCLYIAKATRGREGAFS
jgi:hypothetical protein